MPFYQYRGEVPTKRHTQHADSLGRMYFEELVGEEGFSSDSSLLYHRRNPAAIIAVAPWDPPTVDVSPNHPLQPRHLRLPDLFAENCCGIDAVTGRRMVLGNDDVRISYVVAEETSPMYRNAIGDECIFIEDGTASLETAYGPIEASKGDYVLIPRTVIHRWVPHGPSPLRAYIIEANSHINPPRRYLSERGQFLENAPYCERDLRLPAAPAIVEDGGVKVYVKHRKGAGLAGTVVTYEHHPFDVVGWDGCLYPYAFNIGDFEPLTGRIHQPPPAHQVFEGHNFVICNFVPRKVDYHPQAVPVPYYHSNVDSDEVMFYVAGDYGARKGSGISAGSVSLHPGGHSHGPQPGAIAASIGVEYFDELAVMVDTFRPLGIGAAGHACEQPEYAWSWANKCKSIR
ncbi:homogentisate 1,2-dioxygenase [Nocardia sp. CA-107356]|uniref:homogentisate 1,2-dioxygenase n=1 Tax=Nocardia sp. CA-107356 TaxID=3239972 RepID=UPI003D94ED36